MDLVEVTAIRILDGFEVEFTFSDGLVKRIDLDPYVRGPIFQPLRDDPAAFRSAFVDPEVGAISWPNGADIDTQVLRYDLRPASWDDEARSGIGAARSCVDEGRATDSEDAKRPGPAGISCEIGLPDRAWSVPSPDPVPVISRFFGIVISMFFREHQPPHFHASYGDFTASIRIDPVAVLAGELPPRALGMVMEWARLNTAALLADWEQARRHEPPGPIPPLR